MSSLEVVRSITETSFRDVGVLFLFYFSVTQYIPQIHFKVVAKANVLKYQSLQHNPLTVSTMALASVLTHGAK